MNAAPSISASPMTSTRQSLASPPCSGVCCVACGASIERKRPDKRAKCKPCQLADKRAWVKATRAGPPICAVCGKPVERKRLAHKLKCRECKLADKRAWGRAQTLPSNVRLRIRQDLARKLPRTPETEAKRLAACSQSAKYKQAARQQAAKIRSLAWAAAANSPLTGKFETNCHAKRWRLRTPDRGQIYEFTNLAHFVRVHAELFDPVDLIPDKNGYCNAQKGLAKLSPDRVHPKGSWKGWQWVSAIERRVGNNDLLGASPSQNDQSLATAGDGLPKP